MTSLGELRLELESPRPTVVDEESLDGGPGLGGGGLPVEHEGGELRCHRARNHRFTALLATFQLASPAWSAKSGAIQEATSY